MGPKVFCGRSNVPLAEAIGVQLSMLTGEEVNVPCIVKPFDDGEPSVEIPENVRGADVFLIQSTNQPGDNLVELLAMIDAAMRASAGSITVVLPYFGYARQDKKVRPRVPITAALVGKLLKAAGAHRIVSMDLHAGQIQGFFDGPFDNLEAFPILLREIRRVLGIDTFHDFAFVSPDDGGLERCRETGKRMRCYRSTFVLKSRDPETNAIVSYGIGDRKLIEGRDCLLVDDIVATANSLYEGAVALKAVGAARVFAVCAHPVLATNRKIGKRALTRICEAPIDRFFTMDTVVRAGERNPQGPEEVGRMHVVSGAPLLADAIHAIHRLESVSDLMKRTCAEILAP